MKVVHYDAESLISILKQIFCIDSIVPNGLTEVANFFFLFWQKRKKQRKLPFRRNELVASAKLPPLQTGPCNIVSLWDVYYAYSALLDIALLFKNSLD